MTRKDLIVQLVEKKSVLCVGLDSDIDKLPEGLTRDANGLLEFNKRIIDATAEYTVCYKLNTAFYEALGVAGWQVMKETLEYIPQSIFTIADAKRGDIGNTAEQYKKAFFDQMDFDAVTLAPYMGLDSVSPFMGVPKKWGIVLGLTSNEGRKDIQQMALANGKSVSEHTMTLLGEHFDEESMMFVVGATNGEEMARIRQEFPHYFLLVPGVGTQGGSLTEVIDKCWIPNEGGLLINVSRDIIYQSSGSDFAEQARQRAAYYQEIMSGYFS